MEFDEGKIWVEGLLREADDSTLWQYFIRYGAVLDAVVVRDRVTGASRGYGFVRFSNPSSAKEALDDSKHIILGKAVLVKRPILKADQSQTPQDQQPIMQNVHGVGGNGYISNNGNHFRTRRIFVGGLPDTLTEYEFKIFFESFGKTTDAVIIHSKSTGRRGGFGFITFELEESVELVMQRNYYYLHGKCVEVKRVIPKMANDATDGCNSANGHVGGGSEGIQGPSGFSPHYPPHGPCPGYGTLPRCGKSGALPYCAPCPIAPVNHSHAESPFHGNGSFSGSVMGVPIQNDSEMRGGHNQVNEVDSSGTEAQEAGDVPDRIGDLKLDDRASGQNGSTGASSS